MVKLNHGSLISRQNGNRQLEYINTVREFPGNKLSDRLEKNLMDSALACWQLFGLKGYARVDVRVDSNENVFVLEINANPCISPDSGFVAATIKQDILLLMSFREL